MRPLPAALSLCAFALLASQTAVADEERGFGVSAGIGPSVIRDEDGTETFRGTSFGFSLNAEYRFTRNVALGFGVFGLGTASDTIATVDTDVEVHGFDLFGRFVAPLSESADIYGIIGGAAYSADIDPGVGTFLFDSEAWVFGGGADFRTSKNFAIRIEGRYFRGERDETGGLATIGFAYRF